MLHARDIISIIEMIFYIPTLITCGVVCFRHGFRNGSGWIYTLVLCLVRIAGAICQFVSHSNHSTGLIKATLVLNSIGLGPLMFSTLAFLSRFVQFVNTKSKPVVTKKHLIIIRLVISAGIGLSISGAMDALSSGATQVPTNSRVGIILIIVAYVSLVVLFLVYARRVSLLPRKERRVPLAIFASLPLILVRLVYSACVVFLHNSAFNILTGSVAVLVVMSVIEEFAVVGIYVLLGFLVDR
ncbi:hypothetical protein P153DRAFT_365827 [Dothidotthia symphoricarpi CBS 119687]|uniref:DUF7702 domain-containing protein n=1 Tax=Dothidotthia symphoricarpi CBS 119687 TaxID=1392245 RepID=A0A6A6AID2_9PLEO|nr:uncharacterized protein P153DRAFT_365827 [Dothidotthia symphoricarpi CBS 119687]KAF2130181.1 hypothetical protein P153DRAFT_365827 [Dothidotthia symphoricarpi CBS 119687]